MEALVLLFIILGGLLILLLVSIGVLYVIASSPRHTPQEEMRRIEMEAKQQIQAVSDESLRQFAADLQKHKENRKVYVNLREGKVYYK